MFEKKTFVKRVFERIDAKMARRSIDRYANYLRRKGLKIGDNLSCGAGLETVTIDETRPSMVEIGNNVRINKNFTALTHDGVFSTMLKKKYKEFIPNSGKITIGNNVYFGRNCMVNKGVTIGDNCVIGFGSIVTKDIPSNSFVAGAPAKVLGTLDSYYDKRKKNYEEEAFEYARSIVERFNRRPVVEDFWEEFPLFVNGDEVDKYPTIPIKRQLGSDIYEYWTKNHKKTYEDLDAFLKAAGID